MEASVTAGGTVRWLLRTAVLLVVALLFARTLLEYVPALGALPPLAALAGYWDPILSELAYAVGLPWSHDVRGLFLPGLAVALLVLRTVVDDLVTRKRVENAEPSEPAEYAPPPPPSPARPSPPADPDSTFVESAAAPTVTRSVTGTAFLPSASAAPAARPAAPLSIGRYELLGELGHGAMGVVYKALDPRIGRTVAIKTISAVNPGDLEQYRARFLVEAKSAGRLNHPGIVSVYDVTDDEQGRPCLVLEFIDGETLDHIASKRALALPQALDIVAQVARALGYAHANGVIHRDIKPANVMVMASGQAKLSDFGIAKLEGSTSMTIAGQVMGTPAYMSPEQCTGNTVDARSDIFSLGSVLYTVCVGAKPFPGDTFTAVAYQVAHTMPPPVREVDPSLPEELDGILRKCLAKNPGDRYASATELAADLERLRAKVLQQNAAA